MRIDGVKGQKTGGRKKGTPNGAIVRRRELVQRSIRAALDAGETPLDIMRCAMLDQPWNGKPVSDRQLQVAYQMAPYLHPKLQATITKDITPLPSTPDDIRERLALLVGKGLLIDAEPDTGGHSEGAFTVIDAEPEREG
jgi:hypothetical protein